ncbi:hypothetical protein H920_00365 [Fukomys damarensis]|uniref:Uncharacterized protein n=1 Tax=Fukomys damarensis TaxID=885580 RepID=A0A091E4K0_FUKDA|nr:hypothetical protein H920_00365 [Fukomys damarensis]
MVKERDKTSNERDLAYSPKAPGLVGKASDHMNRESLGAPKRNGEHPWSVHYIVIQTFSVKDNGWVALSKVPTPGGEEEEDERDSETGLLEMMANCVEHEGEEEVG